MNLTLIAESAWSESTLLIALYIRLCLSRLESAWYFPVGGGASCVLELENFNRTYARSRAG